MKLRITIALALCILSFQYAGANVYTVITNADNGAGSLRQAITDANNNPGADQIYFDIPASSVAGRTITLLTDLPSLNEQVNIDATTQISGNVFGITFSKIQITTSAGLDHCFSIQADSCEMYGLFIQNFQDGILIQSPYAKIGAIQKGNVIFNCSGSCIKIQSTDHAALQGNLIGLDTAQEIIPAATGNGIDVVNSYAVSIGGKTLLAYNIISGNNYGVHLENATFVDFNSNFIGTNTGGLEAKPNQYGIRGTGTNSSIEIGGDSLFEKNVISGNINAGIYGNFSTSLIQGNLIGTNITGNAPLGNGTFGIYLTLGSFGNLIGGNDNSKPNTIAYNGQEAIFLQNGTCQSNTFSQNSIFCNGATAGNGGIQTSNGNANIHPPQLLIVTSAGVAGTTEPNSTVEIFQDDTCSHCEGKKLLATVFASGSGTFSYTSSIAGKITATVTDAFGNSSEFSGCTDSTAESCLVAGFTTLNASACPDVPMNFIDQSVTAPATSLTSWFWDFGDGGTSTDQSPNYAFISTGTFTVQLTVTNSSGCTSMVTETVTVNDPPVAQFGAAPSVCPGTPENFDDQSYGGNGGTLVGWNWNFGDDSTSTEQNPVHIYSASGTYTATLVVTNNFGCTDSTFLFINVLGAPVPSFTSTESGLQVTFTNTSTANGNFNSVWNFGDGTTSNDDNPVHTYGSAGTYTVCLTIFDSLCALSDSACFALDVVTGIHDLDVDQLLTVSPNPASNYLTLSNSGVVIRNLRLLNVIGEEVLFMNDVPASSNSAIKINLPVLAPGIYLLKAETDKGVFSRKINIQQH